MRNYLLLAIAAVVVAATVWMVQQHERPAAVGKRDLPTAEESYEALGKDLSLSKADIAAIARLFGEDANEARTPDAAGAISPSKLPLRLIGTITGTVPFAGVATIERLGDHRIATFFVGDEVLPGSVLVSVSRARAVLRTGVALEFLTVMAADSPAARRPIGGTEAEKNTRAPGEVPSPSTVPMDGVEIRGNNAEITAAAFEELTTRRLPEILTQVYATPFTEDGEIVGWRLSKVRPGSVFEQLGFKDDDVVTEINGYALGEPGKAIQALQTMRSEKSFEIKGRRGGEPLVKTMRVH